MRKENKKRVMHNNMINKGKKRLLTYCEGCQGYTKRQPSEWMLKHMERNAIDTWIIGKLCDGCLKRRDDANAEN